MMAADGMWGWGMGFGWIVPLLLIGLFVWGVAVMTRNRVPTAASSSAEEILKQRYARGEIDQATYTRMRKELS